MRVDFIIDGAAVGAASGATFVRKDPVTGAVASEAAAANEADAAKVVESAHRAFPAWSETGPSTRRALLLKAADLLERRAGRFLESDDRGDRRDRAWGGFNVHFAATLLREAAALTTQITGEIIPSDKPGVMSMARAPAGRRRARHRAVERARSSLACGRSPRRSPAATPWSCAPPRSARRPTA